MARIDEIKERPEAATPDDIRYLLAMLDAYRLHLEAFVETVEYERKQAFFGNVYHDAKTLLQDAADGTP